MYQSRILIVFQSELKGKQFFLHLKNSNFKFYCNSDFLYNKKEFLKIIHNFIKLVKNLMIEFEDILTNELPKELLPNRMVDHKIDLVLDMQPSCKTPYKLN